MFINTNDLLSTTEKIQNTQYLEICIHLKENFRKKRTKPQNFLTNLLCFKVRIRWNLLCPFHFLTIGLLTSAVIQRWLQSSTFGFILQGPSSVIFFLNQLSLLCGKTCLYFCISVNLSPFIHTNVHVSLDQSILIFHLRVPST